jgi:Na+/alanine symporter
MVLYMVDLCIIYEEVLQERNMVGLGKVLAVIFAVLCIGGSFGGGNAFQSNQATAQIVTMTRLAGWIIRIYYRT